MKHLQRYIDLHFDDHTTLSLEGAVAESLSYAVVNNEVFVGFYLNWLAREATYLEDANLLLSHLSVAGYASSFAEYSINKYRNQPVPNPLAKDKWTKRMSTITAIKSEHHFKLGKSTFM